MTREPRAPTDFHRFRGFLWGLAKEAIGPKWDRRFDASDIVQETLLRAHRMREQFRGSADRDAVAWLKTILERTLENAMRDHQRERRSIAREVPIELSPDRSSMRLEAILVADASTPSQHAMRVERAVQVAGWLVELPDAQREAIVTKHLWGLSVDETAERMGRTPVAVASLLRRGVARLQENARTAGLYPGER